MQIQPSLFAHNWTNKPFSEENKVPGTLFEASKVAGSETHVNKVIQYEIVLSFKVSLFSQSWKQR